MDTSKFDRIPQRLKELDQWIVWKAEQLPDGRTTKVPYSITGFRASTVDPKHWTSFEKAKNAAPRYSGIGFVFKKGGGLVGLDIDKKDEPDLIRWFDTYAERSVSGTGVHIIMEGELPKRVDDVGDGGRRSGHYELYSMSRYFCFTGDVVHDAPIANRQTQLNQFIREVFPADVSSPVAAPSKTPNPKTHDINFDALSANKEASETKQAEILDLVRNSGQADKFETLWSGAWENLYGSQSEADAALMSILRWWSQADKEICFSLFRKSGLMRNKALRRDYLERTYRAIDSGDTYLPPEAPLPQEFLERHHQETPPWRMVTIQHVEQAIKGTIIEPMIRAFLAPTTPELPFEIGLAKALALAGCAMSGRSEMKDANIAQIIRKGKSLARIRIMTAGGQVPNFFVLLEGKSATGKDMGDLMDNAAMQFKWLIGTAGSEEGIADAYIKQPVGLVSISEFQNWLDAHHWQSRAAGFLTHAFNKGWFSHAMSKRGDGPARETDYCFPNVFACVQPGVLASCATTLQRDSGFLGRFIILKVPEFLSFTRNREFTEELMTIVGVLRVLNTKEGVVHLDELYNKELMEMFYSHKAEPEPSWRRLCNEYYPRIALLLSCPIGDTSTEVTITPDGLRRAAIVIKYLFTQAEEVIGGLFFDKQQSKLEKLCDRILSIVQNSTGGECRKRVVDTNTGRGTKTSEREEAIKELISRGELVQEIKPATHGGTVLKAVVKLAEKS